ncbi:MAG: NAD(P)/FAD-dependent oxidoreductase [Polyangiaceae bacterium]
MQPRWDVIILGGGPGGSTLASLLRQRGRSALVLEREKFPRFHIGESLLPRSYEIFERLGLAAQLDERFLRKYGARFLCSETRRVNTYHFDEAFDPAYAFAYQVPRAEFDQVLLEHAKSLGAEVREEWEAREVLFEGERAVGVRARSCAPGAEAVDLFADVIVDATGRDAFLASRLRKKAAVPRLDKTALFTHYRGAFREQGRDEGNIQIIIFKHGWLWHIPFKGDVASVGAVVGPEWLKQRDKGESLDAFYDRTIAASSWASEFVAGAERLRPVGALADFSYRIDQLAGDGWLFVGDAGGFLDPLFSTGAHLAIKGADLAAAAIDEALKKGDTSRQAFAGYEASVRYAVDLFLGIVQSFYSGDLQETLFEANQRATMRKLITSLLSGDVFHGERRPAWAGFVKERYPAELPVFA